MCRACPAVKFLPRLQALDELALSLPAKQVLPGALDFAARAISAPEPHARLAACTVVVCIAEGCAEAVRRRMPDVLRVRRSYVLAGLLVHKRTCGKLHLCILMAMP